MTDVVNVIQILIKVGMEIKSRLDDQGEAIEELDQLVFNLEQLDRVFAETGNARLRELYGMRVGTILEGVKRTCESCAKYVAAKSRTRTMRLVKSAWNLYKAPTVKEDILRTSRRLGELLIALNFVLMNDVEKEVSGLRIERVREMSEVVTVTRAGAGTGIGMEAGIGAVTKETTEVLLREDTKDSSTAASSNVIALELREAIHNTIDDLVSRLKDDCQRLQAKLDQATVIVDTSSLEGLQEDNPEGISFWRDRFQAGELAVSSVVPFESVYVSWARFVHELETFFTIKKLPTAVLSKYNVDLGRLHGGSWYHIDPDTSRRLPLIRPLWLPALRETLDPLHKGYVRPEDYLIFLGGDSLTAALRRLVLEGSGYGTIVECRRATDDFPLPSVIETPQDHVGWMSACQIVAVPEPADLGIFSDEILFQANPDGVVKMLGGNKQGVVVYVRYLETGQIQRKKLATHVRPYRGLRLGAPLAVRQWNEDGSYSWSDDLTIVQLKAWPGGRYTVTAGLGENTVVFSTEPPPTEFAHRMVNVEALAHPEGLHELEFTLLGSSTIFRREPRVEEKIQIRNNASGYWHDVRVTAVNGEEVEYEDWVPPVKNDYDDGGYNDDDDDGVMGFDESQLTSLGKGNSKVWCPWVHDRNDCDVRPYRCLDIGDAVEAPVLYPDYAFEYHALPRSQLYLPARITDVKGDEYVVEFGPRVMAHKWWPGRAGTPDKVPIRPGATETVENSFVRNQVKVKMDLVRPAVAGTGAHPTIGELSMNPYGWAAFQGVQMTVLQDLVEENLWRNKK